MKWIALITAVILTACTQDLAVIECDTGVGQEVVCIEYYLNGYEDLQGTLSQDDYTMYIEITKYLEEANAKPQILAQVYADVMRTKY